MESKMRQRPAATGRQIESVSRPPTRELYHGTSPVDELLRRLHGVRKSSRGWSAKCPAHEDRSASLSIASGDDGRVLLHCFAGCPISDVLAALGLSVGDLFERRITHATTPAERAELRQRAREAQWRAALGVLAREAVIVAIVARDLARGIAPVEEDSARLLVAIDRIEGAREVLA